MKFKNPICINCQAPIGKKDVDISTDVAICQSCNTIYKFSNLLYSGQDNSHKDITKVYDGFVYEDFRLVPSIVIELKKLSSYKFHFTFSIIVGIFTIVMMIIPGIITKLFSLLFLGLTWYLLKEAIFRYRTIYTLELGEDALRILRNDIEHTRISPDEIAQVYVKRRKAGSSSDKTVLEHDIYIRPTTGEDFKIIKHILPSEVAFEIERIIENRYNIEDLIVKEEYHPKFNPQSSEEIPPQVLKVLSKLKEKQQSNL